MRRSAADPERTAYRQYSVSRRHREPLLDFILNSLEACGCRIIQYSSPETAPFRITFESADGERLGILAYAFFANKKRTKNRPNDEYRFQLKYGSKESGTHVLWQDPYGMYTTLLLGISPDEGFFVGYDPVLHSPTKHYISLEFKEEFVDRIQAEHWAWEERSRRSGSEEPVETIVGGQPKSFLDYVRFEREARGEDQGHRALLADNRGAILKPPVSIELHDAATSPYVHDLAREFEMSEGEVLTLIAGAKRLKMAVRGWVAEAHLVRKLQQVEGVTECERIESEGSPDVKLRFEDSDLLFVECKNVLRARTGEGLARLDFQRTRASKKDPCSRYYSRSDFNLVAACLHALTQRWEYSFALTDELDSHKKCEGKLSSNVAVDRRWTTNIRGILGEAVARR
jgi:restriction-modification system family protein